MRLPAILRSPDDATAPAAGAAPAAEPTTPPAGAVSPTPAPPVEDVAALRRELEQARREAANYRTKYQEARQQAGALPAAQSEAERISAEYTSAQQRLAALEAENRAYRLRDAIGAVVDVAVIVGDDGSEAANPLHGMDARLSARLIDPNALSWGEDGRPTAASLRKALAALRTEYPILAARVDSAAPPAGAPRTAQPPAGGAVTLTAEQIAKKRQEARDRRPNPLRP